MSVEEHIKKIIAQYPVGEIKAIEPITTGWVNKNFRIYTNEGEFILQRLAPVFDERTVEDMAKVTTHLQSQQVPTPELIKTHTGSWYYKQEGELWKLMRAISGHTHEELGSNELAYEAGRALGSFIQGMQGFDGSQLQNPLRLHQTQKVFDDYMSVFATLIAEEQNGLTEAFEYIKEQLPKHIIPEDLPLSVVHGDPKISNIIFTDHRAYCMIDLDTCMIHTPLVDIGDAMWSWCGIAEDHPENAFSVERFEHAMNGILHTLNLSAYEKEHVYNALQMIALELASRFAKDIADDSYFGWNTEKYTSRKAHNRARVASLVHLSQDMAKKKEPITAIIYQKD